MSEATKRVSEASSIGNICESVKRARLDTSISSSVFKQYDAEDDDDVDSLADAYPPMVTFEGYNRTVSYKYETDEEGDGTTTNNHVAVSATSTASAFTAYAAAAAATVDTKKQYQTVLTFTTDNDRFARLQLLSTHTLHDLVSILCQHTSVGFEGNDGPNDHLWYITYNGKQYESTDVECQSPLRANQTRLDMLGLDKGCVLQLTYDYGSTSTYRITLVNMEGCSDENDLASMPRNLPKSGIPASYAKYQPSIGSSSTIDAHFSYLNDWIFHNNEHHNVSVNLFQAGRKKNYGFMNNRFTMIYLPAKPDNLIEWLECLDQGASIKPAGVETEGYTHYTWQSVVPLPSSKLTTQLRSKYMSNERQGFCDAPIVDVRPSHALGNLANLEKIFPKIAALAGLRKDKRVPKGWISFVRRGDQCSLAICRGNAREARKSKAPKGLAFEGEDQHEPADEPLIQISGGGIEIRGLHDLFCVVEGLLRTL